MKKKTVPKDRFVKAHDPLADLAHRIQEFLVLSKHVILRGKRIPLFLEEES